MPATKPIRVLLVDDVPKHLTFIETRLRGARRANPGYFADARLPIKKTHDAGAVVAEIESGTFPHDIIISDVFMPGPAGGHPVPEGGAKRIWDALRQSHLDPKPLLVVISSRGQAATRQLMEMTLAQKRDSQMDWLWLPKPDDLRVPESGPDDLLKDANTWINALATAVVRHNDRIWRGNFLRGTLAGIVGHSAALREAVQVAVDFADQPIVAVFGETGTGKELLVRALHDNSTRREQRLEPCDVGQNSWEILAVRIFGSVAGAFTGATTKRGLLDTAGTLFLDEVGTYKPNAQELAERLSRLLDPNLRSYHAVGSVQERKFHGTIVLGGSRLKSYLDSADCPTDLKGRIGNFTIELPPLRERRSDILPLAEHFLARRSDAGTKALSISREARDALQAFSWPENVRELEREIERLGARLRFSTLVKLTDLKPEIQAEFKRRKRSVASASLRVPLTGEWLAAARVRHDDNYTRIASELYGLPTTATAKNRDAVVKRLKREMYRLGEPDWSPKSGRPSRPEA